MSELTVETRLEHRGHCPDRPDLSATDVYLVSAELGVSYQAAVTQLRTLLKISFAQAREFAKQSPSRLKQELLGGRRPDNPRASVMQLTLADNRRAVVLDVSDELDIVLPEMTASGFEWTLPTGIHCAFDVVSDRYQHSKSDPGEKLFGDTRTRQVTLKAIAPGRTRLDFLPLLPGDTSEGAAPLTIYAVTCAPPTSKVGQGISTNQHNQLLRLNDQLKLMRRTNPRLQPAAPERRALDRSPAGRSDSPVGARTSCEADHIHVYASVSCAAPTSARTLAPGSVLSLPSPAGSRHRWPRRPSPRPARWRDPSHRPRSCRPPMPPPLLELKCPQLDRSTTNWSGAARPLESPTCRMAVVCK